MVNARTLMNPTPFVLATLTRRHSTLALFPGRPFHHQKRPGTSARRAQPGRRTASPAHHVAKASRTTSSASLPRGEGLERRTVLLRERIERVHADHVECSEDDRILDVVPVAGVGDRTLVNCTQLANERDEARGARRGHPRSELDAGGEKIDAG